MNCPVISTDFSVVKVSKMSVKYMDSLDPQWENIVFHHKGRKTKRQKYVMAKWEQLVTAAHILSHIYYVNGKILKVI